MTSFFSNTNYHLRYIIPPNELSFTKTQQTSI